jgi:hypothetical protein
VYPTPSTLATIDLQSFADPEYQSLVQDFPITQEYPFATSTHYTTTTFSGLSIALKPYLYYRLTTLGDARALLLQGTYTTGTAMYASNFLTSVDPVVTYYSFMPFIDMEGSPGVADQLSAPLASASQSFVAPVGGTLQSIEVFTTNFSAYGGDPNVSACDISLNDLDVTSIDGPPTSDNQYSRSDCAGDLTFSFASSSVPIFSGHHYLWTFMMPTGTSSPQATVQFYGTSINTTGGMFGDPSLINARFVVTSASGTLFSNLTN